MKKLLTLGIFLILPNLMTAQELDKYQWENRLVVVFTPAEENDMLSSQLRIFKNKLEALKERKLLMIEAIPGKHKILLPDASEWQESKIYQRLKKTDDNFELILIGLDGGVKLRQTEVLEPEKLFSLIDSMPMRKAEMKDQDKKR
ncbi:DUF4174 domain-containing protein [Pontixanthobacter gangjinensis]|uniref:DUF4174 domain-containing protein n=1 Tax=Christiangramia aestuarii TaxID=1028746 RepID=A0A7K1LQV3_9FLAO|nr:DUF4174 domain-containing protein [Christiangramia aestuarii]MUP43192.1 DUF4174 domain-containing protein [Christiangramia aestuarii]